MTSDMSFISVDQMREVDRLMIEKYGIEVRQMMEIAGYDVALLARKVLGDVKGKTIVCLVGKGNNGGDSLAAGRNLINWGANVEFYLVTHDLSGEPGRQLETLKRLDATIFIDPALLRNKKPDLIIDGLIGYNLKGNPRGEFAQYIDMANNIDAPILAIDVPSGLDGDTGKTMTPCIKADYTLALSLPKTGLKNNEQVGDLYIGDMMVPKKIFNELGIEWKPYFKDESVVRL